MFRESFPGVRLIQSTPSQEGAFVIFAQETVDSRNKKDALREKIINIRLRKLFCIGSSMVMVVDI